MRALLKFSAFAGNILLFLIITPNLLNKIWLFQLAYCLVLVVPLLNIYVFVGEYRNKERVKSKELALVGNFILVAVFGLGFILQFLTIVLSWFVDGHAISIPSLLRVFGFNDIVFILVPILTIYSFKRLSEQAVTSKVFLFNLFMLINTGVRLVIENQQNAKNQELSAAASVLLVIFLFNIYTHVRRSKKSFSISFEKVVIVLNAAFIITIFLIANTFFNSVVPFEYAMALYVILGISIWNIFEVWKLIQQSSANEIKISETSQNPSKRKKFKYILITIFALYFISMVNSIITAGVLCRRDETHGLVSMMTTLVTEGDNPKKDNGTNSYGFFGFNIMNEGTYKMAGDIWVDVCYVPRPPPAPIDI